jgi:hypothetical protein
MFGIVRYRCMMKNEAQTKLCARTNDHRVCGRPKHEGKALTERMLSYILCAQPQLSQARSQPCQDFASYSPADDPGVEGAVLSI